MTGICAKWNLMILEMQVSKSYRHSLSLTKPLPLTNTLKCFSPVNSLKQFQSKSNVQSTNSSINAISKDLEKFMSIYFRMSLLQTPSVRSCWKTYMSYGGSSISSRNHFCTIFCSLYFVENLSVQ